jgi:hypothetical protein
MHRFTAVAGACVAAILIAVPVALGATPQQIYRDYADNGRLDGHYSRADLLRAQQSLVIQGYKPTTKGGLKHAIKKKTSHYNKQGQVKGANKTVGVPAVKKSGGLPFTGLDLAFISIGGVSLLAFGASLRRFARRTNN